MDGEVRFQNIAGLLVALLALAPAVEAGVMLLYLAIALCVRRRVDRESEILRRRRS